ncbi:hypothetical protein HN924_01085 [Candidatus Woesearchaeota archaeon]|jgi:hypothetical protein|nr:hypothetical protein [Candidatus Woesearchaeota archaeon]MBT7062542.1 hypothetical protein [Candidatus Woesearchaeota archaeon]MBT7402873.1 hypothetical protein [Candidatus Woesearchaeota archaeon]
MDYKPSSETGSGYIQDIEPVDKVMEDCRDLMKIMDNRAAKINKEIGILSLELEDIREITENLDIKMKIHNISKE